VLSASGCLRSDQEKFFQAIAEGHATVPLPKGGLEIKKPIELGAAVTDLVIEGQPGDVIRAVPGQTLQALFVCRECKRVTFRNFTVEGSAEDRAQPNEGPPLDVELRNYFGGSGIAIEGGEKVSVRNVKFHELSGFAVISAFSRGTTIDGITVTNGGTRNGRGANTGAGGVAIVEGDDSFQVRNSTFRNILGNGVWVQSGSRAQRPQNGVIEGNRFESISRNAIQLSRAFRVTVQNNSAKSIGFPVNTVSSDAGPPAGVGSDGKVDASVIRGNRIEDINGRCFSLDGYHDGEVSGNTCINHGKAEDYPLGDLGLVLNNSSTDMRSQLVVIQGNHFEGLNLGGISIIGAGHKVIANELINLNRAGCTTSSGSSICLPNRDEPRAALSGIFLGLRGTRPDPVVEATIERNRISGKGMVANCVVAASKVHPEASIIRNNICSE
jgi:hypothetical protein